MPNWCSNRLDITGPDHDIARMLNAVAGVDRFGRPTALSLERVVPTPQELLETETAVGREASLIAKYGTANVKEWRGLRGWGTKWELSAQVGEREHGRVRVEFDSAWSPPLEAIQVLSRQWPTLHFEIAYEELGADFVGSAIYECGEEMSHDQTTCTPSLEAEV